MTIRLQQPLVANSEKLETNKCSQISNIHSVSRKDAYTEKAKGLRSTDPTSRREAC